MPRMVYVTNIGDQNVLLDADTLLLIGARTASPVVYSGRIKALEHQGLVVITTQDQAPAATTRYVSGTTDTLALTDNGRMVVLLSGSAVTVTLPNNLPVNFNVLVIQQGAGQVSFVTASGATLQNRNGYSKIAGQYGQAALVVVLNPDGATAVYNLGGDCA